MENTQFSPEFEDETYKYKNYLLFNLVVIAPLLYILIVFMLDRIDTSNDPQFEPPFNLDLFSNIDLIFIIFIGISILIIFTTYWFVLPQTMKKYQDKGYNESFFTFFLMFAFNDVIALFGLIIGILSWVINDHADWLKFFLLMGIGWIQMIYLYGWKIPKKFRKISFKSSKN